GHHRHRAPKPPNQTPTQPATISAHHRILRRRHSRARRTPPPQHATHLPPSLPPAIPSPCRAPDPPRNPSEIRRSAGRCGRRPRPRGSEAKMGRRGKPYYVEAAPPVDVNKNTEWFMYPGVWTTYILMLFFAWLLVLSVSGCSPGAAWTVVNLAHFAITYHFFHWKKGTPFAADDQGIYSRLTWWEQIDNGQQLTRNRKFLTVVPVVLYLIASHLTDYKQPMFFLNTVAVFVLVVAKLPNMHKVRIFGINADI
ncbi:unnamed protein product, partial [Urochloa humidicola]